MCSEQVNYRKTFQTFDCCEKWRNKQLKQGSKVPYVYVVNRGNTSCNHTILAKVIITSVIIHAFMKNVKFNT